MLYYSVNTREGITLKLKGKYLPWKGIDDQKQVYFNKVKQVSQIDILRSWGWLIEERLAGDWRAIAGSRTVSHGISAMANALYVVFI